MPRIATNKKVLHDYHVLEKTEAGIVLSGAEVKSIKTGQVNLKGSYVSAKNNEIWLTNAYISPYKMATTQLDYNPNQERKLLLSKKEIASLIGTLSAKGLTVMPLSVYTKGSLIKVEIGVCRGKKKSDKRELIKKRETDRKLQRTLRAKV